jgi:hypothetical protein
MHLYLIQHPGQRIDFSRHHSAGLEGDKANLILLSIYRSGPHAEFHAEKGHGEELVKLEVNRNS